MFNLVAIHRELTGPAIQTVVLQWLHHCMVLCSSVRFFYNVCIHISSAWCHFVPLLSLFPVLLFQCKNGCNFRSAALLKKPSVMWHLDLLWWVALWFGGFFFFALLGCGLFFFVCGGFFLFCFTKLVLAIGIGTFLLCESSPVIVPLLLWQCAANL